MTLSTLAKKWGLNPSSVLRHVLLDEEGRNLIRIEKYGKLHTYHVLDAEGLKQFLIRKGFPVKEEADV